MNVGVDEWLKAMAYTGGGDFAAPNISNLPGLNVGVDPLVLVARWSEIYHLKQTIDW